MESKRVRQFLLLDGAEIEIRRRRDPSLRQLNQIVDRVHFSRAKYSSGHELCRQDRGSEVLEYGLSVCPQAE